MTTHTQPRRRASIPSIRQCSASTVAAGSLRLLTWPALAASGADAAVTARAGGVSSGPYATLNLSLSVGDDPERVLENRRRLAAAFGAGPATSSSPARYTARTCAWSARQNGGVARSPSTTPSPTWTRWSPATPGLVLAILTADCVPIVLHDPVAGVLACVHAGWRGTVARVAAAAVAAMQTLGSRPADVIAGIGPAMAPDRYQVGPDVHHAVTQSFGPAAAAFLRPYPGDRSGGHWLLDLWAANRYVLQEAGVPDAQIHVTGIPTGPAGHDTFFSDRAARPCGRLALVARLGTT